MAMIERVEMLRYRCSADDCGTTHHVAEGKTPPGFTGQVTRTETDGTTVGPVDYYACRTTHIRPAVVAVTEPNAPEVTDNGDAPVEQDDDEDAEQDADTSADALSR